MASKNRKSGQPKPSAPKPQEAELQTPGPERAIDAHKSGDLDRAEKLYRDFLVDNPTHGRCLYLLGLLLSQQSELVAAATFMARGLAIDPRSPSGHNNLGIVYLRLNQPNEAQKSFIAALEQDPELIEALINLGSIYQTEGHVRKAEKCFRDALAVDPNSAEAGVNLGALLRLKGNLPEAEEILRHAIACAPSLASAHNNLGIVLHEQVRLKDAFMAFKKALEIDPSFVDAYNNLGSVFRDQNQLDAALACYDKALTLDDAYADTHNNNGAVLQTLGRLDEAETHFRRANELKPGFPPALTNLGTVLHKAGDHAQAQKYYESAIAADPEYAEAHFGLAELLLYVGDDLKRGWQEHFWRWQKKELRDQRQTFACPLWQGEALHQKTIRIWGEQGIGEEIMYATFIPDLIEQGATVQLECEDRLVPLFERSFPTSVCRGRGNVRPFDAAPDFHCAAAELGQWLRPKLTDFPVQPKLLNVNQERRNELREKYRSSNGRPLIGISWFSRNPEMGWEKSIDLTAWAALLKHADKATFVDLQYGDTSDQRAQLEAATGTQLVHDPDIDQMQDLDGFAAQVAAMDLVISISNTTVHMAGALGIPTWCLLSDAPLWRWFKGRDDCLWYAPVQFFRQSSRGDWDTVLERVERAFADRFN